MPSTDGLGQANKQAACLNCRKSKVKCKRTDSSSCDRCRHAGTECTVPGIFHVGRQKGVKNKRSGLQKAIHQVEEALRRDENNAELQRLLQEAQRAIPASRRNPFPSNTNAPESSVQLSSAQVGDEQLALDDAENPLRLLARASDLRLATPQVPVSNDSTPASQLGQSLQNASSIDRFFLPMKSNSDGHGAGDDRDMDPIDAGLVTADEADELITFFYDKLAHTRWGFDPYVHRLPFIRSSSSFLLTSMLAASALFMPTAAALAKRLSNHAKLLAHRVITKRLRSVEIVLAFLVNIPWMHPGAHSADDDTGLYISTALSIALDLSLNKIVVPSISFDQEALKRTPKADCIDAARALAMDGFDGVDPSSEWGRRLLFRRERTFIALFVLERGVCLARGRNYSVPITPLIKHCDRWHCIDVADHRDGAMISMTVLRRDLDDLFSAVRLRCDSYGVSDIGSNVARDIETSIESFYDQWLAIWTLAIGEGDHRGLPPYVEILVTHTRLSTYSGVINHPTAPLEVKRLFRASALSSALNVMRAAIQGEARLMSMPNNTAIMISFAACVALNLTMPSRGAGTLAPSIRQLIEETAAVLERIGRTPKHRNGMSIFYGEHLREIMRQAPVAPNPFNLARVDQTTQQTDASESGFGNDTNASQSLQQLQQQQQSSLRQWAEQLQFSAMSDDQINEAILHAQGLDFMMPDFPSVDANGFVWLDWMDPPEFGF